MEGKNLIRQIIIDTYGLCVLMKLNRDNYALKGSDKKLIYFGWVLEQAADWGAPEMAGHMVAHYFLVAAS